MITMISKAIFFRISNGKSFKNINLRTFADTTTGFRVLGVQQIAIGSVDKQVLNEFWGNLMGIKKISSYRSEKENVDEDIYLIGDGVHAVELDLMQPINPDKPPKVHIPSLNHIGLWVDSLHNAVEILTKKGIIFTPGGIRKGAAGFDVAFIHPKSAVGVLVELVQAPKEILDTHK